jgi:hypothetical protein
MEPTRPRVGRITMNIRSVLLTLAALMLTLAAVRQTKNISGQIQSLERFLRSYVGDTSTAGKQDARYSAAFVNLSRDGSQQVIVYLTGREWCGSGGCTTLVLVPKDSTYKVQTKMTVTRLSLRVLSDHNNGWHDLGVWVQGGGVEPGYEARLRFNGTKYPNNPTPQATRLNRNVEGQVVIPAEGEVMPLYP